MQEIFGIALEQWASQEGLFSTRFNLLKPPGYVMH
jgi:hypothetical protein